MRSGERPEPRQYVDFSAVAPSQWAMHDRLLNWARWCEGRDGRSGDAAPMFALYKSTDGRREYGAETSVPVKKDDAQRLAKGIAQLPDKHRRALHWYYLRPRAPTAKARELGVSHEGLATLVQHARLFLINQGV